MEDTQVRLNGRGVWGHPHEMHEIFHLGVVVGGLAF